MAYIYNLGIATVGPLAGFDASFAGGNINVAAGDFYTPPFAKGGEGGFGFNMPGVFRRTDGGAPPSRTEAFSQSASKFTLLDLVLQAAVGVLGQFELDTDNHVDKITQLYESDKPQMEIAGVNVRIDIPEIAFEASADIKITKIISYLLHNAVKYKDPDKPEHFVKIHWDNGKLIVEDNGIGIADVNKVLNVSHYREHPEIKGDGLGIICVQRDVGELGWRLELQSEVGKFTKFIFHTSPPAGAAAERASDEAGPNRSIERPEGFAILPNLAREFIDDLVNIFNAKRNPYLDINTYYKNPPSPQDFPLTMAVFERAIACKMEETGRKRKDIIVCVPGCATNVIEVLNWLQLGVKVVSVQVPGFGDILEAIGEDAIKNAKESGQLIIKHAGDIDIPKADIVVWTHPGPIPPEYVGMTPQGASDEHPYPPTRYEHLIEYSSDDGIVIIETEFEDYLRRFKNDFHFRELLPPSSASDTSYLLPSQMPFPGQLLTAIYKRENFSSSAERALRDGLAFAWAKSPPNARMLSDSVEMSDLSTSNFPRLSAMLDALIESKIRQGKKREDIVVCVAAHGVYTQTIRLLLEKGVKVVSREKDAYHDLIEVEEEFERDIANGRLHLSNVDLFDEGGHNYDIKIWEHPHGLSLDKIVAGVAKDGLIAIQTGSPQIYIAGPKNTGQWTEVFAKLVHNSDYLVPSTASKLVDGASANVSVFIRTDRRPADNNSLLHPLTGEPIDESELTEEDIKELIRETRRYYLAATQSILRRYREGADITLLYDEVLRGNEQAKLVEERLARLIKWHDNKNSSGDLFYGRMLHRYSRPINAYSQLAYYLSNSEMMRNIPENHGFYRTGLETLIMECSRVRGLIWGDESISKTALDNNIAINFEELEEILESLLAIASERAREKLNVAWSAENNSIVITTDGGMVASEILAVINRASAQGWQLSFDTSPDRTELRLKFPE